MIETDAICVDVKTAARRLGVSEWTVRAWCSAGTLATVRYPSLDGSKTNRRILIRAETLETFAKRFEEKAS